MMTMMTMTKMMFTGNPTTAATANGKEIQMTEKMSGLANWMNLTMIGIHGGIIVNYMKETGIVPTTSGKAQVMKILLT